jgi:hypothetical protein
MGMILVVIANVRIITNMLTVSFDPVRGISSHGHTHSLYDTARRLLNDKKSRLTSTGAWYLGFTKRKLTRCPCEPGKTFRSTTSSQRNNN